MLDRMARDWQAFEYKRAYRRPRRSDAYISINQRGRICLNAYLMEKLGFPRSASLFYDAATRSIGILPHAEPDEEGIAFPIYAQRGYRLGWIGARVFLENFGIGHETTMATNWVKQTPEGMVVIDLDKMYAPGFRRSRR